MGRIGCADMVKETTATTGTGTYDLDGTSTGFRTFVGGWGTGNSGYYSVTNGTDWEVGIGTVTDGTPDTLSRDTILSSSNAGAAVNWGAGSKTVRCVLPAAAMTAKGLISVKAYTTPGTSTWSKEADTVNIIVECIGGGAGGNSAALSNAGGGGGAGGGVRVGFAASAAAATETVTVGSGGATAASGGSAASAGGASSFGTLVVACGGAASATGTAGAQRLGGQGGGGAGTVTVGRVLFCGGDGDGYNGIGIVSGAFASFVYAGDGGDSKWGAGGRGWRKGVTGTAQAGSPGILGGGGAGGAATAAQGQPGSAGGAGAVIVWEFA